MPYKSSHPCHVAGCPNLVIDGAYCKEHRTRMQAPSNPGRQRFETSTRWRIIRRVYLAKFPLCQDCLAAGKVKQADEVHHIDNDHTHNKDSNLAGLCIQCHSKRTRAEHARNAIYSIEQQRTVSPWIKSHNTTGVAIVGGSFFYLRK